MVALAISATTVYQYGRNESNTRTPERRFVPQGGEGELTGFGLTSS